MATFPKQESIDWVINLGGVSYQQAVTLLKKHNNDADRALGDFLDNGDRAFQVEQNTKWEHADNLPAFHMDPDDTRASSVRAALSRPPSRASYRNEPIDLTAEHAAADPSKVLTLQEQQDLEDAQLQRAIALSKQDDSSVQENGITGAGQQFGPATGAHYPYERWAITKSNTTTREIFEHPRPSKRRRVEDQPAFLRGSKESGYLAPLLTIYHSIPLAREALLFPAMKVHAYGHDPTWWSGASDENYKSVSVENSTGNHDLENVLCEMQSLMAFLDSSHRAYGSVDALSNLRAFATSESDLPISHYVEIWKIAAMKQQPEEPLTQIFSSEAFKAPEAPEIEPVSRVFHSVDPAVVRLDGQSIYDVLDSAVWHDNFGAGLDDVWIDQCAEVFTMRLHDPMKLAGGLGVKIPAIWYPDRYLEECRTTSWDMRSRKQRMEMRVHQLSNAQARFQNVQKPDRTWLRVRETLQVAREATDLTIKEKTLPNGLHEDMQPLLAERHGITQSQLQDCEGDLQNIIQRIEQKINEIETRKDVIRQEYKDIGLRLTQPSENPANPPHHKYVLQGVSTLPHITYVRRPIADNLVEIEDGESEQDQNLRRWQWWRISFSNEDSSAGDSLPMVGPVTEAEAKAAQMTTADIPGPASDWSRKVRQLSPNSTDVMNYSIRKVREVEVLKAAREESNEVILVYANEHALNFQGSPLTTALKAFVEKDNEAFEMELRNDVADQESGTINASQGSTENRAVFEDILLDRQAEPGSSMSREMTPMSLSSPKREVEDYEQQPSPKRTKASSPDDHMEIEHDSDDPPPYHSIMVMNGSTPPQEMQERRGGAGGLLSSQSKPNRIGQHAEEMLERMGKGEGRGEGEAGGRGRGGGGGGDEGVEVLHIEHSMTPLR